jgi:hypothetical protein
MAIKFLVLVYHRHANIIVSYLTPVQNKLLLQKDGLKNPHSLRGQQTNC